MAGLGGTSLYGGGTGALYSATTSQASQLDSTNSGNPAPGNSDPFQPSASPLAIAGFIFAPAEAPQELPIGAGEQRTVTTEMTGGSRVVQSFGAQPSAVTWSGTFWAWAGGNVEGRMQGLRAIMVAGKEVLLSWRSEKYYCIVTKFEPGYYNANRGKYSITVEITRDANGFFSATAPPSLDAQVSALMTNASAAYASAIAEDPTLPVTVDPSLLSGINVQLQAAGPLAQTVGAAPGASIIASVQTAIGAVNTYLGGITDSSPAYLSAVSLLNSLTLVSRNVLQGQSPNTIQIQGGDVYEEAIRAGLTIDEAIQIADANDIPSMRLPTTLLQTLTIPPLSRAA